MTTPNRLEFSIITPRGFETLASAASASVVRLVALDVTLSPDDKARARLACALDAAYVDRLAVEVLGVRPRTEAAA